MYLDPRLKDELETRDSRDCEFIYVHRELAAALELFEEDYTPRYSPWEPAEVESLDFEIPGFQSGPFPF